MAASVSFTSFPNELADSSRRVDSVLEHHGGVKVIYRNGQRVEFGRAEVQTYWT